MSYGGNHDKGQLIKNLSSQTEDKSENSPEGMKFTLSFRGRQTKFVTNLKKWTNKPAADALETFARSLTEIVTNRM